MLIGSCIPCLQSNRSHAGKITLFGFAAFTLILFSQALSKEVSEWRRREEANNCLRRRFEESRQELESTMKKAGSCLKETGEAEELLRKHSVR